MKKFFPRFTLAVLLLAVGFPAGAQQQTKMPKIGWLGGRSFSGPGGRQGSGADLFGREFAKLGYVEGNNLTTEYRYADDKLDRLPALADELVRLKVDVIIAPTTVEALAAKNAT
jgi:putative tryptophan/tyrosine transport system substrate-binding protein